MSDTPKVQLTPKTSYLRLVNDRYKLGITDLSDVQRMLVETVPGATVVLHDYAASHLTFLHASQYVVHYKTYVVDPNGGEPTLLHTETRVVRTDDLSSRTNEVPHPPVP